MEEITPSQPDRITKLTSEPDSKQNGVRPLLPAPARPPNISDDSSSRRLSRKRPPVALACEPCRKHKLRCNSGQPRCSTCQSRSRQCVYREQPLEILQRQVDELQRSRDILARLFHAIRDRPTTESREIFHRIRAGANVESILRPLNNGDPLLQLHLKPETNYRYEFPFRSQIPAHLQLVSNPYLGSLLYEGTRIENTTCTMALSSSNENFRAQYLKPCHAATILDARLDGVAPSKWTNVSTDDSLMRRLLRTYFLHEYNWFTFFHKDHFLDDMLVMREQFCSPLLVNAVLAHACYSDPSTPDRAQYWNPNNLAYKFFAEAKRLWELERLARPSLTTLQAALVMTLVFNMCGMDKIGITYLHQAVAIADDLKLFNLAVNATNVKFRNSSGFTTWCLFHLQSVQCFHFMIVPLITESPKVPMPDPAQQPQWYGEFWIKYPLSDVVIPMNFGHTFKALAEFAMVLNDAANSRFPSSSDEGKQIPPKTATDLIASLKVWYHTLPDPLRPLNIVFPAQLKLHMYYHNLLINLYELCVAEAENKPNLWSPQTEDPHSALIHSRTCFETLMRLYYLRHGFEAADSMLTQFLGLLAFMSLSALETLTSSEAEKDAPLGTAMLYPREIDPDDVRSALIIAGKGLKEQGDGFYASQTIFHVVRNSMTSEDAVLVQRYTNVPYEDAAARQMRAAYTHSEFPLNIVSIRDDPVRKSLKNLIIKYAETTIEPGNS